MKAAKEIATLDVLSGGRVAVTVGVGGRPNDYRAVSAPFERRHARMDEQVARMRAIWRGEPPFAGADPVGPAPLQVGGPPIYAGVMGPKATARAARWADGVYVWSGNGVKSEIAHLLAQTDRAFEAAKRTTRPRRIGGFWYSLAPEDALGKLRRYVHDYVAYFGEAPARAMASAMDRATPDAVRLLILRATFPSIAGKLELEYGGKDRKEGEVVEELSRRATKVIFDEQFKTDELSSIINSFNNGIGAVVSQSSIPSAEYLDGLKNIPGLKDAVKSLVNVECHAEGASAIEFILEGLHLSSKLNKESLNGKFVYK